MRVFKNSLRTLQVLERSLFVVVLSMCSDLQSVRMFSQYAKMFPALLFLSNGDNQR